MYPAPTELEPPVGTWRPELLEDFIARQHISYLTPRIYAHQQAKGYVEQTLLKDMDPDELLITTLYINAQDHEPQRATVAYSMTLTDALMRNWQQTGNGQFFDHLSQLREYREGGYPARISQTPLELADCFAYEAIYRKTIPQRFDRSTHMAIDPKDFKRFAWDADLQAHFQKSMTQFWSKNEDTYNLLIKAALLKSAYVQHSEGSLSAEDKALVLKALGLDAGQSWETLTLERFTNAPLSSVITFRELILYRYVATDILVIKDEQTDRLVVYIPGNSSPLHVFDDLTALGNWVALQCKEPRRRQALESHFKLEDDSDGLWLSGVKTALAGLAVFPHYLNGATGYWRPHETVCLGAALKPWPFSHMRRNMKERLESDGRVLFRTRADYNKEIAAQALTNVIMVTGAIAMVVPYMWAPLAAMSLALTGLGADEVIEGTTLEDRQKGGSRIVFGVLNAVPAAVEGAIGIGNLLGAAARAGDEAVPGAADEAGQLIGTRSPEQRSEALQRQQQEQAQMAEEAQERARESAGERQLRLDQEEQRRLASASHRQSIHDSAIAFGVEPEGLRSLAPELRTELARLEYNAPLEQGGAWGVDEFGAVYTVNAKAGEVRYFARVHSKIYRVERITAARQYRIFSPDNPSIKGPYIRRIKGYYSDIDLKPGLRGGDSYIEVPPAPEPVPEVVKEDIVLARAQPPVNIEIPMDGIEVRPGIDDYGLPAEKYFAMNVPDGTPVYYDADIAGWRRNEKMYWLDNKGVWKSGSEKAYLRVREKLKLGIRTEIYTFPRLPGFPANPQAVDLTVHQIWLGYRLPRTELIDTIKANMEMSPELKFVLHIDIDSHPDADALIPAAQLRAAFSGYPNITISELSDEPFFQDFINDQQTAEPFHYFRRGKGQNLAAASDVVRYRLVHQYGGIYMDCDDVIRKPFQGAELNAGPSDVLVGGPVSSPKMSFFGPNNSHFASHAGNPVLREIQKELYSRFTTQFDALDELSNTRPEPTAGTDPYMSKIFEITGPRLFLETLKKTRPDYASLLDAKIRPRPGIRSLAYLEYLDEAHDFYAPFGRRLRIIAGAENSWKAPSA
jgi:hypothetical protein